MQYNLADLFESCVDVVPDRPALVMDDGTRLTFAELDKEANKVAHHLLAAGIKAGDHVGCHMINGLPYVASMLGCFKIRAVPVNINYRYVREELEYLYKDADLVGLIFDDEFAERVKEVADGIDGLRHLVLVGDATQDVLPKGTVRWSDVIPGMSASREGFPQRSPDDLYILYTGGTTGMPKGVMWRHEDIFFAGMGGGNPVGEPVTRPDELAEWVAASGEMVMLSAPPLMHGAAFLGCFISWFGGRTTVIPTRFSGPSVCQLIQDEKAFTLSIVGDAMAVPIVEALEQGEFDCSGLFIISSAGAILSQSTQDRLKAAMPQVFIMDNYGSSETGFNGTATDDSSSDSGLRFKVNERTNVIADDHTIVAPGSVTEGRVAQSGHIPLGYYNAPQKTAETFPTVEGRRWVLTGDRATVDEDGVIHFIGRGSVCINTGGEKVFPEEVESALKAHPAIRDTIVAGVPDERFGQRVGAVLELVPGAEQPSQEDVAAHLADRIARYKVPRLIHIVDEVVRSPVGKPDYRWAARTLTEVDQARRSEH
ncbi:MAG: acyl-CoA synthetase (AMP-forming)/AMP-acid ligase II [Glaciecola sp.]|jgi:acyl-CoA synthetase (AMP-forming)/AMP-acid ligase II